MKYRDWMVESERLMNAMESFPYKSEQYNLCRKALMGHIAQKPKPGDEEDDGDDDQEAWAMTGPAKFL